MKIKRTLWIILVSIFLISSTYVINAEETDTGAVNWKINNVGMGHTSIKFTIENVEVAQDATICIKSSESEDILEVPFSITSATENIGVDFPDNQYLKPGTYSIYVKDKDGSTTETKTEYVYQHSLLLTGTAYPRCIRGKSYYNNITHVTASVGFQQYEGVIDSEGNIVVEFPIQKVGAVINILCQDDYGCSYEYNWTVKDKRMSLPNIKIWRENATLSYDNLDDDERLCVQINDQVYYSEYGIKSRFGNTNIISYPAIADEINKVSVWLESKYGSSTDKEDYEIQNCELKSCKYTINAYPSQMTGSVNGNEFGHIPSKISVILNSIKYSASINPDGTFAVAYPEQADWTKLEILFEDVHGCTYRTDNMVRNIFADRTVYLAGSILLSKLTAKELPLGTRLYVEINGVQYISEYSTIQNAGKVTVTYPKQIPGTLVKVWYQSDNTSKSKLSTYSIYSRNYEVSMEARTTGINGYVFYNSLEDGETEITSVYVEAGGIKYPCVINEISLTDMADDMEEVDDIDYDDYDKGYYYQTSYPKQALGSTVSVTVEDADGYVVSKSAVLKNIAPKISVNKIDSGTSRIIGETAGKANIKVSVGKKVYKGKANSNGIFSIKIKQYKAGTVIKISVETVEGYTVTKKVKVKTASSSLTIKKNIYKNSNSIKITVGKARKGDKIIAKIGSKSYKKKLTANKVKQNITIKLKDRPSAGKTVKIILYDKFGKKKDEVKSMVYVGDSIYVGMSAADAVLTTWGTPIRKNDWGAFQQWVFKKGSTTLYVYIQGGTVKSLQRLNY